MNAIRWTEKQSLVRLFPLIISISFAMDVFVPAIPEMSHFFNTTNRTMQASLYMFMLTVAIGQLLVGPLADRFGRRRVALGTAILFFAGSLLSSLAPSVPTLIIARVIQAAGACGTYLLSFIIVRDNFSTTACARLFSMLNGTNSIIASAAPIIGGLLLDLTQDWHSEFYFLTLLGFLMSIVVFRYIPDYNYPKSNQSKANLYKTIRKMIVNPDFRKYTLIAASSLLGLYLFCALSPEILITKLHLSPTTYGLFFGLNAVTVCFSNMIAARLTYSYPLEKIVFWGLVLMLLACFFMIIFNLHQSSVLTFMLPMLCLTVGIGTCMGSAAALALKDFEQQAGIATALLGSCQFGLAGLIGILVAQLIPGPLSLAIPVFCFSAIGFVSLTKFNLKILRA
ncbi:Bcr/CflA family drug resistance efflux transporter [Legionella jamestowniensis]|uniref:Bcr/CflA family efflux transporter n=1 Tax=Legionella jamestowniensis TaxID=455 RepID=A0ABX2XRC4_9GAMM|nr:multidrug effflux MFS transporter [Legionella jamestowniensis]OCH96791.1 Bcr/CflA family drug resistance efflux transporter [Legionella jamestowniensis]